MTGKQEESGVPRGSLEDVDWLNKRGYLHLCLVAVTSAIGGFAGYIMACDVHTSAEKEDESRAVMRIVRDILSRAHKRDFIASHPPRNDIVAIERPSVPDDSHTGVDPSPSPSISQRILAQCYPRLTSTSSLSYMRSYLERDLLANGVSQHDADIIITSLAHSLDTIDFVELATSSVALTLYFVTLTELKKPHLSAFRGAPFAVRASAFAGHALFMGAIWATIIGITAPNAVYADLVQDKRTVAAVLRAKFSQEPQASSRS